MPPSASPAPAGPVPLQVPPPPRPPRRSAVRVVLLVGLLVLVLWAVNGLSWGRALSDTEVIDIPQTIDSVVVDAAGGRVEVRAGDAASVTTTSRSSAGWDPEVTIDVDDGRLEVRSRCPGWRLLGICSASHVVVVPSSAAVQARSTAGAVTVEGVEGAIDARSNAGRVQVTGAGARVNADSSAGSIEVVGALVDVTASSSAGSVRVTSSVAPDRVDAGSSAGSVRVTVPDETYRVDAGSSAGSTRVEVRTDPGATREIRARSSAGSVTVTRG
jgi:hypothetical protein